MKKSVSTLLLVVSVPWIFAGCKGEIHGNSPTQKEKTVKLMEIVDRDSALAGMKITSQQSYHLLCINSKPKVPHANCIHLVVEGKDKVEAVASSSKLVAALISKRNSGEMREFAGAAVIISSVTRNEAFTGEVTPNTIANDFTIHSEDRVTF